MPAHETAGRREDVLGLRRDWRDVRCRAGGRCGRIRKETYVVSYRTSAIKFRRADCRGATVAATSVGEHPPLRLSLPNYKRFVIYSIIPRSLTR